MDKRWIGLLTRMSREYLNGIDEFISLLTLVDPKVHSLVDRVEDVRIDIVFESY